jgi:hypothetical protein
MKSISCHVLLLYDKAFSENWYSLFELHAKYVSYWSDTHTHTQKKNFPKNSLNANQML